MTKRGFTMIELLVVIVILGILASLIIPGVNKALVQARFAGSQSNLRQIGIALMLHAQDHDGLFPSASGTIPYNKNWKEGDPGIPSWQMQLIPYTGGNEKIFFSSYSSAYNPKGRKWSYFLGSHAAGKEAQDSGTFNLSAPPSLNLNKIREPSHHILAGEDHTGNMDLEDSDKDDYNTNNPAFGYAGADRRVNVLFADGHIDSPKRFDPAKMAVKYEGVDAAYTGYE